jgi:hypothetical protein
MEKLKTAIFSERHPIFVEACKSSWRFSQAQLFVPLGLSLIPPTFDYIRTGQFMGFVKTLLIVAVPYTGMLFLVLLYNFIKAPLSILTKHHFKLIEIESRLATMSLPKAEIASFTVKPPEAIKLETPDLQAIAWNVRECFIDDDGGITEEKTSNLAWKTHVAVATFRLEPTGDCPQSIDVRGQIEIFDSDRKRLKEISDGIWFPREKGIYVGYSRGDIHELILAIVMPDTPDTLISYKHKPHLSTGDSGSSLHPELAEVPGKEFIIDVHLLAENLGRHMGQKTFSFDLKLGKVPTICLPAKKEL